MGIIKEFKEFINKGNVIDLAVAVVLGSAFGKIVDALVKGLVMPLVGLALPGGDWKTWTVGGTLNDKGELVGAFQIGAVLGATIDFVIIAFVVFLVVNKLMKALRKPAPVEVVTPEDTVLLREIRDALKNR